MYSAAPPAAVATPAASTARRRGHQPAAHAAAAAASSIRPTRSAHRPLLLLLPIALLLFLVVLLASSVALAAPLPFAAATVPDDALHSAAANTAALERRSFLKKLKHAMHKVGHGLEQAGKGVAKGVTHGAQAVAHAAPAILKKVENATPVTRGITNLAKTGINAGKAIAHHENIKTIAKGVGKGLLKTAKESIPNGRDLKTIKTLTSFTPAGKLVAAGIGAASTVASIGKGIAQHKNVKTILKDAGKTAANAALDSIPGGGIAKKAITAAETVQKVADKAHH